MCTVGQLIVKLQQLPQDAIVEVLEEYTGLYYTSTEFKPIDLEYGISVLDYTDDDSINFHGKIFVHLEA